MKSVSEHNAMVHNHRDVQGGSIRAAIFGISDGLVSNAALILGVAAAQTESSTVLLTGISGLLAGGISMASGEYVSMKAQNELIEREIEIEKISIRDNPQKELHELQAIYMGRGLQKTEAAILAEAIHRDPAVALEVHAREELGVDPHNIGNPFFAALSSFGAFTVGAAIPLIPWMIVKGTAASLLSLTLAVIAAIAVGISLAHFTERSKVRTATRQVLWAAGACLLTFLLGTLFENGFS